MLRGLNAPLKCLWLFEYSLGSKLPGARVLEQILNLESVGGKYTFREQ